MKEISAGDLEYGLVCLRVSISVELREKPYSLQSGLDSMCVCV